MAETVIYGGPLRATGNQTITGGLTASGASTFSSTLSVSGALTAGSADIGAIGGTTPAARTFTSLTDTGLTSTYFPKAGTNGLLGDSILNQQSTTLLQLGTSASNNSAVTFTLQSAPSSTDVAGGILALQAQKGSGTTYGPLKLNPDGGDVVIGGRITFTGGANSNGITFGSLGTATIGIDQSSSGLSGTDYLVYFSSTSYWQAQGLMQLGTGLRTSEVDAQNAGYKQLVLRGGASGELALDIALSNTCLIIGQGRDIVGVLTSCTVAATSAIISKTGIETNAAVGDLVHVTSGTGVTTGFYRLITLGSGAITVDRNLSGAGGSNIAVNIYKNVIGVFATDGTNGQQIMNYSAQNKPLQIGGDTLAATVTLTSKDLYIGGDIGFSGQTANGTVATTITSLGPTGTQTTIQGWIKIIDSAGTARYIPYW